MFENYTFWTDHAPIKSRSLSSSPVILILSSVSLFLYPTSYILILVFYTFNICSNLRTFFPHNTMNFRLFLWSLFPSSEVSSCSLNNGVPIGLLCFSEKVFSPTASLLGYLMLAWKHTVFCFCFFSFIFFLLNWLLASTMKIQFSGLVLSLSMISIFSIYIFKHHCLCICFITL